MCLIFTTLARGVLLIVPRTLIDGFLDKTAGEQSCGFLLQVFQKWQKILLLIFAEFSEPHSTWLFFCSRFRTFYTFPYFYKHTTIRNFRKSFCLFEMLLHRSLTANLSLHGCDFLGLCVLSVSFTFPFGTRISKSWSEKSRFFLLLLEYQFTCVWNEMPSEW